jgi:hypothetical protein
LHNANVAKYEFRLASFEEAGRRMAVVRTDQLADATQKHDTAPASDKDLWDAKIKLIQADIDTLRKVVIIPNEEAQTEFADYEQWFSKFSAGYEYVGSDQAFAKGFARIGMTIGFHYARSAVPEDSNNWHPLAYGMYSMFTIALTNSGEAKPTPLPSIFQASSTAARTVHALDDETPATPAPAAETSTDNQLTRALEFEFQGFSPWWRNDYQEEHPRLRTSIGPLLVLGGRKLDSDAFLHYRAYFGIRNARSPETFYDILYGRTSGLTSRRIELRGQYALPHAFKNGGRLAIGVLGNLGANKRKREVCDEGSAHCHLAEKDVIKFYISYDIDGPGVLSFFGLDKKPAP